MGGSGVVAGCVRQICRPPRECGASACGPQAGFAKPPGGLCSRLIRGAVAPHWRRSIIRRERQPVTDALWWILSAALIVAGLAGVVLPALPGTALVLAGIVLGAWIDDFTRVGGLTLTIVTVLAVLAWVLDYVAGLLGARRAGASPQALLGAALGTVVGLFMGLVGVFFMPLVGAVAGEYWARRDEAKALHVGLATWVGIMLGLLAKVVLSLIMVGVFVVALLT